jgi:hypothetical protein
VSRAEFVEGPTPGFDLADANHDGLVSKAEASAVRDAARARAREDKAMEPFHAVMPIWRHPPVLGLALLLVLGEYVWRRQRGAATTSRPPG